MDGGSSWRKEERPVTASKERSSEVDGVKAKANVVDGSEITNLVKDERAFTTYVDHKFMELDRDHDGRLSVQELQPAVADIGAALGLPSQGSSPKADHIYSEVLNEFTHGKEAKVNKTEFKGALSDILLGMAAGLKRDPIVILRMDGEDLKEYIDGPRFQSEAVSIFSHMESTNLSLCQCITKALEELTVEHGMPPSSDPWVFSNVVEPVLQSFSAHELEQPVSQELFLEEFKKFMDAIVQHLKQHPVIVAHSENTFDGSGIKRLLSNRFELDKLLDTVWRNVPKDGNEKASKECLCLALDGMSSSAGLPPYGAVEKVDVVMNEAFKMLNADGGKFVREEEFKKILREILGSIMLQLEGTPIFISVNSVIRGPTDSSSTLLPPSSIQPGTE